jgi:pantoate--beta-alanine ligase
MGALHEGHASLVARAVKENDEVLASIFVNPTQFQELVDLDRYPRTLEQDCEVLERLGATAVYLPTENDMYPRGFQTRIEPGEGAEWFEGEKRPGHFTGMLTVVLKLFQQTRARRSYFGEKDAQQLFLVRRMVEDLDLNVEVLSCATIREPDGLAMSSRNARLSETERFESASLWRALSAAKSAFDRGERRASVLEQAMHDVLKATAVEVEYASVIDDLTFRPPEPTLDEHEHEQCLRAILAVRLGAARLIDNLLLGHA